MREQKLNLSAFLGIKPWEYLAFIEGKPGDRRRWERDFQAICSASSGLNSRGQVCPTALEAAAFPS